jgi:hypothetical protein
MCACVYTRPFTDGMLEFSKLPAFKNAAKKGNAKEEKGKHVCVCVCECESVCVCVCV